MPPCYKLFFQENKLIVPMPYLKSFEPWLFNARAEEIIILPIIRHITYHHKLSAAWLSVKIVVLGLQVFINQAPNNVKKIKLTLCIFTWVSIAHNSFCDDNEILFKVHQLFALTISTVWDIRIISTCRKKGQLPAILNAIGDHQSAWTLWLHWKICIA